MFSRQESQGISTSDEEEYRAQKMALLIQDLLVDEKGTWISTSYSTAFLPGNRTFDDSSESDENPSSRFPLNYSYGLPDKYIESLANLDKEDQRLSIIDIESESDPEEHGHKSTSLQKYLTTDTKDSCTQTQCIFKREQSTTHFRRCADPRYYNFNKKDINTTNTSYETDEIPTLFSPLDLSPSLDSDSGESMEDLEVNLTKPTKNNNFIPESSSTDSQTSSTKTNLKPDISTNSDSSKTSDRDTLDQNILSTSNNTTSSSLTTNARNPYIKLPPGRECQCSYDHNTEQNSDSESLNKSKSITSSSGGNTKSPRSARSEAPSIITQIFTNPSNQRVNNLLQSLSQDRRKPRKIYASVSENWNALPKNAQGISKITKYTEQSFKRNLNLQNTKPGGKRQSTPNIQYKNENNYTRRSPSPTQRSPSKTSDSSSNSFLDIFLAKNPSVLLNNSNNRQTSSLNEHKRYATPFSCLHNNKQKNYLQISSSRKRKRKVMVSKEKPTLIYFLKDYSKMSVEGTHLQPSNNDVKILMPAKPGRMENSDTSSSPQSSDQLLKTQRTEHHNLLHRFCSVFCKCSCFRRN